MFSLQGLLNVSRPENVTADEILKTKKEPEEPEAVLHAPRALSPALKHKRGQPHRSVSQEPPESNAAADPRRLIARQMKLEKHQPTPEELLKRERCFERVAALKKLVPQAEPQWAG